MLPKKWGVRCRTPHLGLCLGCLGRFVTRGSLFCASSVCTPFRPPPSPGFPVRITTTSLRQRTLTRRQAAKARRATIASTTPPLELPHREVRHQLWPGARRATTKRLVGRPFVRRSFSKPSAAILPWFHTPRGCPLGTLRLRALATSGQQGCPLDVRLSVASSPLSLDFALPLDKRYGNDRSSRAQTVPPRLTQPHKQASASACQPLGLPPRDGLLGFRPGWSATSSRVAGPTEQAACATSKRSSCRAPAVIRLRASMVRGCPLASAALGHGSAFLPQGLLWSVLPGG